MAEFQIREAADGDLDVIVDFNARIANETENKVLSRETLEAGVGAVSRDADRGRYFVACTPQAVVGQLMITTEWSDWRNGLWWWIQSVYVHPDYRGRGVFRALFRHVERLAQERPDVVGLRLYVHRDNHAARRVYERLGMQDAEYLVLEREIE
jgi:GNAT superfamily N-acetyltransferase